MWLLLLPLPLLLLLLLQSAAAQTAAEMRPRWLGNWTLAETSACVVSDDCCCSTGLMTVKPTLLYTEIALLGGVSGGIACLNQNTLEGTFALQEASGYRVATLTVYGETVTALLSSDATAMTITRGGSGASCGANRFERHFVDEDGVWVTPSPSPAASGTGSGSETGGSDTGTGSGSGSGGLPTSTSTSLSIVQQEAQPLFEHGLLFTSEPEEYVLYFGPHPDRGEGEATYEWAEAHTIVPSQSELQSQRMVWFPAYGAFLAGPFVLGADAGASLDNTLDYRFTYRKAALAADFRSAWFTRTPAMAIYINEIYTPAATDTGTATATATATDTDTDTGTGSDTDTGSQPPPTATDGSEWPSTYWAGAYVVQPGCTPSRTCCCGVGTLRIQPLNASWIFVEGALDAGAACFNKASLGGEFRALNRSHAVRFDQISVFQLTLLQLTTGGDFLLSVLNDIYPAAECPTTAVRRAADTGANPALTSAAAAISGSGPGLLLVAAASTFWLLLQQQ